MVLCWTIIILKILIIVYELKTGPGNIIFYCLLELQSTVDYLMPFRLLLYITEIWRNSFNNTSALEREKKAGQLPAIIPLVLYNGTDRWQAPKQFRHMLVLHPARTRSISPDEALDFLRIW